MQQKIVMLKVKRDMLDEKLAAVSRSLKQADPRPSRVKYSTLTFDSTEQRRKMKNDRKLREDEMTPAAPPNMNVSHTHCGRVSLCPIRTTRRTDILSSSSTRTE